MAGSHAYEIVNKGHPKMFLTLCFPIPMIKCSNNQWCASIKDLMFVIYLQLHNVIMEMFSYISTIIV